MWNGTHRAKHRWGIGLGDGTHNTMASMRHIVVNTNKASNTCSATGKRSSSSLPFLATSSCGKLGRPNSPFPYSSNDIHGCLSGWVAAAVSSVDYEVSNGVNANVRVNSKFEMRTSHWPFVVVRSRLPLINLDEMRLWSQLSYITTKWRFVCEVQRCWVRLPGTLRA